MFMVEHNEISARNFFGLTSFSKVNLTVKQFKMKKAQFRQRIALACFKIPGNCVLQALFEGHLRVIAQVFLGPSQIG